MTRRSRHRAVSVADLAPVHSAIDLQAPMPYEKISRFVTWFNEIYQPIGLSVSSHWCL